MEGGPRALDGTPGGERGADPPSVPLVVISTGCELRPVEREIDVDLFKSFVIGLFIDEDRERSPV